MWELPHQHASTEAKIEEISLFSKLEQLKHDSPLKDESLSSKSASQVSEQMSLDLQLISSLSESLDTGTAKEYTAKGINSETLDAKDDSAEGTEAIRRKTIEDCQTMLEVAFDPEKCVCCSVEGGQTLVHSLSGKGYGVAAIPISSGCYQWKVIT